MNTFTILFLLALALSLSVRLWLAQRHVRHIQDKRTSVPIDFASEISLEAHQKAADYSSAKTRFGMLNFVVDAAVLLLMTIGGLLQWLGAVSSSWFSNPLLQGALLIGLFTLVTSLIDLPFGYYRTFSIESRFGF